LTMLFEYVSFSETLGSGDEKLAACRGTENTCFILTNML
jgi:hypothetical protein